MVIELLLFASASLSVFLPGIVKLAAQIIVM
jgi:hypothetical protein